VIGRRSVALLASVVVVAAIVANASRAIAGSSPSGSVSIEATLDRDSLPLGGEATLTIVVRSTGLQLPSFEIPRIPGVAAAPAGRAENFSMVNGRIERSATVVYRFLAQAEGRFTIPAITVGAGGDQASTDPLNFIVSRSIEPGLSPRAGLDSRTPGRAPPGAPEVFLKVDVDKPRVYWNQQVLLRLRLYSRVEMVEQPDLKPPSTSGFWSESLGPPRSGRVTINGIPYAAVEVLTALFPTRTGPLTIGPAQVRCVIARVTTPPDPWSALAFPEVKPEELRLSSDPVTVTVDPLPPGAPPGFQGAVGDFALALRVDRKVGRAGEPVTVHAVVKGEGNISSVRDPDIRAATPVRQYVSGSSTRVERKEGRITGERALDVSLVPDQPGAITILPVRFSWFDPEVGRYRSQSSDTIRVEIRQGDAGAVGVSPGPLAARGAPAASRSRSGPIGELTLDQPPAIAAIAAVSLAGYGFALALALVRERRARDPRHARRERLTELETRQIARAHALAKSGDTASAAGLTADALHSGMGHRYGADLAGLPRREALDRLRERGAGESELAALAALFESLERIAYAPPESRRADVGRAIDAAGAKLAQYRKESS